MAKGRHRMTKVRVQSKRSGSWVTVRRFLKELAAEYDSLPPEQAVEVAKMLKGF